MNRLGTISWALAFSAATLAAPMAATASGGSRLVLGEVPAAYRQVAREYDVPPSLLFAIAVTESGRTTPGGRMLPWPWTLNVDGRAFYYRSREEASSALRKFLKAGHSPDVGLMQVNWRYHGEKLGDPSQALDPWLNLRAGALILREAYEATGDWWQAVGRYHSATPRLAEAYRKRVARWQRRIG